MWKPTNLNFMLLTYYVVVNIEIGMIDDGLFWGLPCVPDPNVLRAS